MAEAAVLKRAGAIGAAASVASVVLLVFLSRTEFPDIRAYVATLSMGAGASAAILLRAAPIGIRTVFIVAAGLHGATLFGRAAFEDDYYRFLLDGWRLLSTGSPYGVAPQDLFVDGGVPPEIRALLSNVNNPEIPTIYGPAFQLIFASAFAATGTDLAGLRLAFIAGNLLLIALMLRRFAPERVALYAWSPFVIAEIGLNLHADAIIGLLLFAGLMAHTERRPGLAGAALGIAAACKLVALAAWPILLFGPRRGLIVATLALAALYAPFVTQASDAGFGAIFHFAAHWRFNPLVLEWLDAFLPAQFARLGAAAVAACIVALAFLASRRFATGSLAIIFIAIILCGPAVNPWYFLWALPFAVSLRLATPIALTIAAPLSYLNGLYLGDESLLPYEVHPLAHGAEGMIIALAILADFSTRSTRRRLNRAARLAGARLARLRRRLVQGAAALTERQSVQGAWVSATTNSKLR